MPIEWEGLGEEIQTVNLPAGANYKEIMANVGKVNNAGWKMGNFYAAGFSASISSKNETTNISKREIGAKADLLGKYTLGEIGLTNNKENTTGDSKEDNRKIEGGAVMEVKIFGRQKNSKIEGNLYIFYEINN